MTTEIDLLRLRNEQPGEQHKVLHNAMREAMQAAGGNMDLGHVLAITAYMVGELSASMQHHGGLTQEQVMSLVNANISAGYANARAQQTGVAPPSVQPQSVQRVKAEQLAVPAGHESDIPDFIESDFNIRSGKCPNNCGPMVPTEIGQECPACKFSCNVRPEASAMN
jgi:hypothetical protein